MLLYIYRTVKRIKFKLKQKSKKIIIKYQLKKKFKKLELKIWLNITEIVYGIIFISSCILFALIISCAISYYYPPVDTEAWLGVVPGKDYSFLDKYKVK